MYNKEGIDLSVLHQQGNVLIVKFRIAFKKF